jgi:flagellar biosynthesis protein FliP
MRAGQSLGRLVLLHILVMATAVPLWARSPGAAPRSSLSGPLSGASSSLFLSSLSGGPAAGSLVPSFTPSSSAPWNIVILLTLLTMIPAIVLSMTPFVRLLIVFHFLRQALGTQTAPSNQTLIGLSLVLTFFLMQPVGAAIYTDAIVPLDAGHITMMAALDRSVIPMRHFMLKFAREKDLALFVELAHEPRPARPEDLGMRIVAPAYLLSELQAGFRIGAALFFPFLVIDMVTAAITTSIGMMQLPPVIISTPLKILLFVVVDGWNLLVGSLMRSFS